MFNLDPARQLIGYVVRHGETVLNATNCWRGWEDPELNENGIQAAYAVARYLSYERIGRIICSDLVRAYQTAEIILNNTEVEQPYLGCDFNLRSWNVGMFAGQEKTAQRKAEFQYYIDNPLVIIPGGESLQQARDRNMVAFQYLTVPYKGLPSVIVVHTSNITSMMRTIKEDFNGDEEFGEIVEPGGLLAIYLTAEGKYLMEPVFGAKQVSETPEAAS